MRGREVSHSRAEANAALPEKDGSLQDPPATPDGEGGITGDWTDAATNVPFRIGYGMQSAYEHLVGEQFQGQMRCSITFRYDQAVSVNQRLYQPSTGRVFHIHGFTDAGAYNISKVAYCTEIQ